MDKGCGIIFAPGEKIELGSVAYDSLVRLTPIAIVTGKGGIAPSPTQARDGEIDEVDLVEPVNLEDNAGRGESMFAHTEESSDPTATKPEIIEAQSWIINDRGNLELVAYTRDPNSSPQQPNGNKICHKTTRY